MTKYFGYSVRANEGGHFYRTDCKGFSIFRVREINFKDEHEEMRTQLSMILRNLSLLHQTKTGFHDYSPYNRMEKIWSLAVIYHN